MYIYSKTISNQSHEVTKAKLTFVILVYNTPKMTRTYSGLYIGGWEVRGGGGGEGDQYPFIPAIHLSTTQLCG